MPNRIRLMLLGLIAACLASTALTDEPKPAASMLGTEAGQVRDDNELKMKLVWCPPGVLTMEQIDRVGRGERSTPVKTVLTHGYWLARCEVMQAEWRRVMATEPWKDKNDAEDGFGFPATWVCWDDAIAFCRKLTERERAAGGISNHWEYTLPTEAQWEHSCRAGTTGKYCFGDEPSRLGEYAWFQNTASAVGERYAHRVGQKLPNAWGLHDMHGNVHEWCLDMYRRTLPGGNDPFVAEGQLDPTNEFSSGKERVCRGGNWDLFAGDIGSARRGWYEPSTSYGGLGFRVALTPVRPAAEPAKEARP